MRLYEHDQLHAKVLATKTQAVIGSANASANSTTLAEAAIVTENASLVKQVRQFVQDLASQSTPITQDRIDWARGIWNQGRGGGPPGTDGEIKRRFPTNPRGRLYLMQQWWVVPKGAVEKVVAETRSSARRRAGLAQNFEVDSIVDPSADHFRIGDLAVIVEDDYLSLWEIDSAPIQAGRTEVVNWMRRPTSQNPISLTDAKRTLRSKGVTLDLTVDGMWVRDSDKRDALLGLWPPVVTP